MKIRFTFEAEEVAQLLLDQLIDSGKLVPGAYRVSLETLVGGGKLVSLAMVFNDPPTPIDESSPTESTLP